MLFHHGWSRFGRWGRRSRPVRPVGSDVRTAVRRDGVDRGVRRHARRRKRRARIRAADVRAVGRHRGSMASSRSRSTSHSAATVFGRAVIGQGQTDVGVQRSHCRSSVGYGRSFVDRVLHVPDVDGALLGDRGGGQGVVRDAVELQGDAPNHSPTIGHPRKRMTTLSTTHSVWVVASPRSNAQSRLRRASEPPNFTPKDVSNPCGPVSTGFHSIAGASATFAGHDRDRSRPPQP